jgi:sulfoxide reductase catalytic subunit YedY
MTIDIPKIPSSEITPESVYYSRRKFMLGLGAIATGTLVAGCGVREAILTEIGAVDGGAGAGDYGPPTDTPTPRPTTKPGEPTSTDLPTSEATAAPKVARLEDELGDGANSYRDITHFNNYYEFTEDKQSVADMVDDFETRPWTVQVGGLVNKPTTFDIDDILKQFPREQRVYRHRCVEGWSMVIPWDGFELAKLLQVVEPQAAAKYVRFETLLDPAAYPGQSNHAYPWPYVEGLRLDEAMNPLALLVTGLYGKDVPVQNGAPLRLAVPWKYGFKSIKGIVKIDLVAEQPTSLWMTAAPNEYGFYANVNPEVDHPRWSQATERRIGEAGRRPTLMFNGYEQQVAALYAGMDLSQSF